MIKIIEVTESYGIDYYAYIGSKLITVAPSEQIARARIARELS